MLFLYILLNTDHLQYISSQTWIFSSDVLDISEAAGTELECPQGDNKRKPTAHNVYQSASEHRKHGFSKFFRVAARRDFLTLCSMSRLAAFFSFL